MKSLCLISVCLMMMSLPESVCGEDQTPVDSVKVRQLPEYVVTGIQRPAEVIPAQSLNGEELESLNAHSVADAMRYFSGTQVKDYGGVGGVKTIDVRGMGSSHTGVFYDGIQITNAQNGQVDLGRYSLENIEEISMYNGQKSEIFQPARDFGSASSVYIRTRRPVYKNGKPINLNVALRGGSFGLVNPSVRFEWKLSRSVSLAASAEYTFATGRYRFRYRKLFSDGSVAWDTTAIRHNGMIHALRGEASVFGDVNGGRWCAKLYYYDSSRGIPGAIVNNVWKTAQHQWDRNLFAQGSVQKSHFNGRYEWMVNAKYARDHLRYLNPDTTLMYLDNTFNQDEIYLSTSHKMSVLSCWDISASADWQWDGLRSDMANFSRPERNMLLAALASAWQWGGVKAQATVLLTEVWDRHRKSLDMVAERGSSNLHRFTPAFFLSWRPERMQNLSLHGFYKRIFRMPTFNDLYYTDMGNAKLKPEYATQYSAGIDYTILSLPRWLQSVEGKCDVYYNRVSDKIIAVPKGTGQYRWMMMNIGEARILGVDASLICMANLPGDISLGGRLSYSYERARDYSDPADTFDAAGTYKGQIAYIPLHSGSVTAQGVWKRCALNYSFIYVGERWDTSSNIPANYVQPWYTHDMSLQYDLSVFRDMTLRATFEINNLFNQQYEVIRNYPMPGRNYRLTLRLSL